MPKNAKDTGRSMPNPMDGTQIGYIPEHIGDTDIGLNKPACQYRLQQLFLGNRIYYKEVITFR